MRGAKVPGERMKNERRKWARTDTSNADIKG